MKPIDKGNTLTGLQNYGQAKPDLIDRMGPFCSYCESPGSPTQLHVEHIYPEATTAHPKRAKNWRNFLLACATCNTYKRHHLGDGQQVRLLFRALWPHLDNTLNAFSYLPDGRVTVRSGIGAALSALANELIAMAGLLRSPAAAQGFENLGIAYDGISRRKEAWGIAENALAVYLENPSPAQIRSIRDACRKTGYFSIWMEVFSKHHKVRQALIAECKAAPACFDPVTTQPLARGRV